MSVATDLAQTVRTVASSASGSVVAIGRDQRGSGVVIGEGKVLTNAHNLRDRTTSVTFAGGRTEQAAASGVDLDGDLVVLDVDTGDALAVRFGPAPELGDVVVTLTSTADGIRATTGHISSVSRVFRGPRGRRIEGAVEHTAPMAPGSSGSALFDAAGRVTAINTHRLGGGFYLARPIDESVRRRLEELVAGRSVQPRRLGVALAPTAVARKLRRSVGLPERDGLLVRMVDEDSAAHRAGIGAGDLLVGVAGRAVSTADELHRALDTVSNDTVVRIDLVRGAEELSVDVRFGGDSATDSAPTDQAG